MLKKEHYEAYLPKELCAQIDSICSSFSAMQAEAKDIVSHGKKMPDSTAQLNDVLKATEEATLSIIESANSIQEVVNSGSPPAVKEKVNEQITRIFEACNFQDISGQRIGKVLRYLSTLEQQLMGLSEAVKVYAHKTPAQSDSEEVSLTNGPQLTGDAPTQAEVDNLFSSSSATGT